MEHNAELSLISMEEMLCEMRDFVVNGFRKEDLGRDAELGGTAPIHRYTCQDDVQDLLFTHTMSYSYVNIWCDTPFALNLRRQIDGAAARTDELEWIPFYDGYGSLRLTPGQQFTILAYGGGGAARTSCCILESLTPMVLDKHPSMGPFVERVHLADASISTTALAITAAVPGFWTAVTRLQIYRIGTTARQYELQDGAGQILDFAEVQTDDRYVAEYPKGGELLSRSVTGNALQIADNNAIGSIAHVTVHIKRFPILK